MRAGDDGLRAEVVLTGAGNVIRGDKTAIELFERELTSWPSNIAWLL